MNCFGFGGTNAHVIIDDAGTYLAQRDLPGNHRSVPTSISSTATTSKKQKTFAQTQLLLVSSHDKDGIARILEGHAPFVAGRVGDPHLLADYAYTLSRRSSMEYKTSIVAQSAADLAAKLADPERMTIRRVIADDVDDPRLALVFCGQGAQWHGMGRELMEFEPFCNSLVGASKYLSKIMGSDFDLLHELCQEIPSTGLIHEPKFAQPATTAVQVALVDLLRAAQICPKAVVGHSSGEIAAAYAAGHITREDAWLIAYQRGHFAQLSQQKQPGLKGRMMAVGLSAALASEYIAKAGMDKVVVACENSPVSVTVSGDEDQVLQLARLLAAGNVFYRLLAVKTAYHSPHMRVVEDEYRQSLTDIMPKKEGNGPQMFSSVTGNPVDGSALGYNYWADNLVSPVLFNQAFSAMYKIIKPSVVVEISPTATLSRPVREIVTGARLTKKDLPCISVLKRDQHASVTTLEALGELWTRGVSLDLSWSWTSREGFLPQLIVDLPPYPFNHAKNYWFESHMGRALRFRKNGREDLIGAPVVESTALDPRWRGFFRLDENPWLADHQVQKATIYPAAGLLTMALEAARQCTDISLTVDAYRVTNFTISKPVIIPPGPHGLENTISTKCLKLPSPDAIHRSAVYSFSVMTRTENGIWQENADGIFTILYGGKTTSEVINTPSFGEDHQSVYKRLCSECTQVVKPRQLYERLDGIGMNYGPSFQNIVALSKSSDACTSIVRIPDTKAKMPAQFEYDHLIHPATLDAMFQTVFAIGDTTMVPSYIRQITFSPSLLKGAGSKFHGYATAQMKGYREAQADIVMSDESFKDAMITVKGLQFVKIQSDASGFLPSNRHLCSKLIWKDLGPVPTCTNASSGMNEGAPLLIVVPDGEDSETIYQLKQYLSLTNCEYVQMSQLSDDQMRKPCISLMEVDRPFLFDISPENFSRLKKHLALSPSLLWVTTGAQQTAECPTLAPFHGLARTLRSEDSSMRVVTIDIGRVQDSAGAQVASSAIQQVFNQSFFRLDSSELSEVEYSLRDGKLSGARLEPLDAINAVIEKGLDEAVQIERTELQEITEPVQLNVGNITDITSTYFVTDESGRMPVGPREVRIQVSHTNLFPIDLETVTGKSSQKFLGADVIGTVLEIGMEVEGLACGSLVAALARSTIKTSVVVDSSLVHQLPDASMIWGLSPTALVTAYYGLHNMGCISSGDVVFVDRAAGPYGDAALRISKALGATVYVGTTSDEERTFIHQKYDVPTENIVDTSADRFCDEIMCLTGGRGVDFFFSPCPDYLEQSAQCVAEHGHLFQVINTNSNASKTATIPHHSNLSFHKFDLFAQVEKRPQVFSKSWAEVFQLQISGRLGNCPHDLVREERVEHLDKLWANMAASPGRQLNTVSLTDKSVVPVGKNPLRPAYLDPNATYVLVGGLGGLGKAVAQLLIDRGARHLMFLSRSGAKTQDDLCFLQLLSQQGATARAFSVDICDEESLRKTIFDAGMPPIKGAVQCAAVIADAVWETMTHDEWSRATRPKMIGSWNLHNILPQDMDFFIFLSSASGVIGNRGQANYAAGNCFQDALARHRAFKGMKNSVSIDLGPVMGAGMLENDDKTCAVLKASGFFMVMVEDFLFILERAIAGCSSDSLQIPAQVVTGVGTGGLILQNEVADPYWSETKMFELLNNIDLPQVSSESGPGSAVESFSSQSSKSSGRGLSTALQHAGSREEAVEAILSGCIEYLSYSLSMDAADMDAEKSLAAYGVDSLVTSSFRNWIYKNIAVKITDMEVIGAASIVELSECIAEKRGWNSSLDSSTV